MKPAALLNGMPTGWGGQASLKN